VKTVEWLLSHPITRASIRSRSTPSGAQLGASNGVVALV